MTVPAVISCARIAAALLVCAAPGAAAAQIRLQAGAAEYGVSVMTWRDIPFRTVVRQAYDFSCGSAAVATLLTYHYGRPTTEADVFKAMYARGDQARIRKVGFSMLDMKRYLDTQGLRADGFRMPIEKLAASKTPAIALIDLGRYRHFVVVKGVAGGRVLVGDPALGLKTYDQAEFAKMWNGIVFAVRPRAELKPAFNRVAEWRPWAVAPLGAASLSESSAGLTREFSTIYQINPVVDIRSTLSGGG